jgi:nucleoside-diphosphate kinase
MFLRANDSKVFSKLEFRNSHSYGESKDDTTEKTLLFIKPKVRPKNLRVFLIDLIISYTKPKVALVSSGLKPEKAKVEEHYSAKKDKPFYKDLVEFTCSESITLIILHGEGVVERGREILEVIRKAYANPDVIRENCIHGSDSIEEGKREIGLWIDEPEYWTQYSF